MITIEIKSLNDLNSAAKEFLEKTNGDKKFAVYGKMGVGKTTFIKYICKNLGVSEKIVNSPTFTIINEYKAKSNDIIYHFDFYRINKLQEIIDIGAEEYFYSDNFCFIEWPEIAESILPESFIKIYIDENHDKTRSVKINND